MIATASSWAVGFGSGLVLPVRAARLILREPGLRRWSLAAVGLSALLLVALAVGLAYGAGELLDLVWERPEGAERLAWWLLAALTFGLLFALGAAAVPPIAAAPIADPLSAATERVLGIAPPPSRGVVREALSSIARTTARVVLLLAGQVALLPVWLIPAAGAALGAALSVAWTSAWIALEYLDVPGNRHGLSFSDGLRLARAHVPAVSGFGLGVYVLLWIPLLNVVFIPVAVVGGTMLFAQLAVRRA